MIIGHDIKASQIVIICDHYWGNLRHQILLIKIIHQLGIYI